MKKYRSRDMFNGKVEAVDQVSIKSKTEKKGIKTRKYDVIKYFLMQPYAFLCDLSSYYLKNSTIVSIGIKSKCSKHDQSVYNLIYLLVEYTC